MSQQTKTETRVQRNRRFLKNVVKTVLQEPDRLFNLVAMGGCAVLGYRAAPKDSKLEVKAVSTFSGVLGYKLALAPSMSTSTVGLSILAGLGVIASLDIIADLIGAWQDKTVDDWAESEDVPTPIFRPDMVPGSPGARYCLECPEGDWLQCAPYLSALLNEYKNHYNQVHVTSSGGGGGAR